MKLGHLAAVFVWSFAGALSAGACTSWVIRPELSSSGRMIIQKILDLPYRNRLDADIRVAPDGRRWIRVGYSGGASMAMNEKGLAITTNCGDPNGRACVSGEERHAMSSWNLVWLVKSCATAEEAVEALKNIGRNGLFVYGMKNYGSIVLVADARRAFLFEIGDGYGEACEVTGGMHVVANAWSLPGGETVSEFGLDNIRGNRARTACAVRSLQQKQADGKYTIRGCFDTSREIRSGKRLADRHPFVPGNRKSRNMSLETTCFEIDPEFPAFLSCAYISLGPQRHMVYLPVPMAVKQLPRKMRDGSWSRMAFDHQAAFGPEHGDLPKIAKLEDKFLAEFTTVRAEARRLLKDGKKDEAVKLLNDCFDRQYAEADRLMTSLQAAAKEKLKAGQAR